MSETSGIGETHLSLQLPAVILLGVFCGVPFHYMIGYCDGHEAPPGRHHSPPFSPEVLSFCQ